jgi:hypothetical protein
MRKASDGKSDGRKKDRGRARPDRKKPEKKSAEIVERSRLPVLPDDESWREMFREAMIKFCSRIQVVAENVGFSRKVLYDHMRKDREFSAFVASCVIEGLQGAQDEAIRRAIEGILEPIYQHGKLVGHKRVFSDYLLAKILGAHFKDYATSAIDLRASVMAEPPLRDEDLEKFVVETPEGNRAAHAFLNEYMAWREKMGLDRPESEPTPEPSDKGPNPSAN